MPKASKKEAGGAGAFRQICLQRVRDARLPLAICALALVVYSRSLFCGFVRDDFPQIVRNPQVQSWSYLPQLLASHLWSQMRDDYAHFYRPIFSMWMLLVNTLGGLTPWFWHLSSNLLHAIATYLVFRFCQRLTASDIGGAAAAAIFAVHPIHVDAVTWVSASCEVLYTIFVLAAMLTLLPTDSDRNDSEPRVWRSAIWFGAGLFAKETAMVMLAILPVIAWVRLRGHAAGRDRFWKAAYPYGVVAACYLLIRWAVMHRVGVEGGEHSWAEVVFSAPSLLIFYLKKLFLPWNLSGSYVNPLTASPTALFWMQLGAIVVGATAIVWIALRSRSVLGLAAALIVIPILPPLAVIRIYQQGDMTHDRYLYLPSIGVSLLVALLVKKLWSVEKSAKVALLAAASVVFAAFTAEAIYQQRFYQDDVTFYSRVIEISPSDGFAMGMLGNVYLDRGQNDLALDAFRKAHQIAPGVKQLALFLARGLFVSGKYQEAESVLKQVIQKPVIQKPEPNSQRRDSTLLSLANVEIALGNLDYAQQLLEQISQSDDKFPNLHWAWGVLYQRRGQFPQALTEYEKEVEITGDKLAQERSVTLAKRIQAQSGRLAAGHSGP